MAAVGRCATCWLASGAEHAKASSDAERPCGPLAKPRLWPRSLETESYAFYLKRCWKILSVRRLEWALTLVACASLTSCMQDWMRRAP